MLCVVQIEMLSEAQRAHPYAAFCSRLDQLLMVGAYDQVGAELGMIRSWEYD
jgi:hypothetical protein